MSKSNELIRNLMDRGFSIVPIPNKQKSPTLKNWSKHKTTNENFDTYFPKTREMNVGVLNGKPSGNIVDIDVDNPIALDLVDMFLPETGMIFGRKSNPGSHRIYRCDDLPKSQKFKSEDGCIIEIRSTGSQTVFPPSTHPSGELIEFDEGDDPAKVDKNILEQGCCIIAVATILVENYPEEGMRNDFAMVLSSIALRLLDGDVKRAERFVKKISELSNDEEVKDRVNVVSHTAQRMKNGEPVVGIPTMADMVGGSVARDIERYVPSEYEQAQYDDVVTEINKDYAFVLVPPSYAILKEVITPGGYIGYELYNERAFQAEMAPFRVGKKSFAQIWRESPKRRKYEGIEFRPQTPSNSKYNTFRGFAAKPIQGDCSLILAHIKDIVCCRNEEHYAYFMAWFAHIIQEPENKCGTCIILRGGQGCGKTTAIQMFGRLLGAHFKVANNERYLAGRFNGHFQDCLLFNAEEAFFAGSKNLLSILKDIITGNTLMIEEKGLKPYEVNNFVRIIVSTNEEWAVNAGLHERRFFILDVSDQETGNKEYFEALWHQYDNGGREALMHHLMHLDYSDVDLRSIPKTEALLEQKIHSFNHLEKWWFEALSRGSIGAYEDGWSKEYGTKEVFNSYLQYAGDMRVNYKSISTQVGTFLKRIFPELKKLKGSYTVYDFLDDEGEKRQGTYYIFPSLKRSRKAFEEYIGQEIKWGEDRI